MNKIEFKSRKDASKFLSEKGIDTSDWTEEKWLSINKGQAEIHMMALAEAMWDAMNESTPKQLKAGEWHIPFGDKYIITDNFPSTHPQTQDEININIKLSVARCARVSYTVVGEEDKVGNYENDIKLFDRLLQSGHMSPFEHIGKAMSKNEFGMHYSGKSAYHEAGGGIFPYESIGWSGNFRGFIQYRKTIE